MKLYRLFETGESFKRLKRIRNKKALRMKRIDDAYKYLNEWHDIPISELFGSVCDILKIKKTKAAMNLIYRMNMDLEPQDLIKIIPLSE